MRSLALTSPFAPALLFACLASTTACQHSSDTSASSPTGQTAQDPSSGATAPGGSSTAASAQADTVAPAGADPGNAPAHVDRLLADVAEGKACDYLEGRYLALSAESGTSFRGGKQATVGTLWVDSCEVKETAPDQVHVSLGGRGWKWIDRETDKLLADFQVSQYLRFKVDADVPGTLQAAYAPDAHLLSVWLEPTDQAKTRFIPTSHVNVDEESLWSEVVGGAASVVGKSPEEQANQKAEKGGKQQFRQRIDKGLTYAIDLCSGRSYKHSGILPAGQEPDSPVVDRKDRDYLVNSNGIVHGDGMIFAGPFDAKQQVIAQVIAEEKSAPISARWFCADDAHALAEAYFEQHQLPSPHPIAHMQVQAGHQDEISVPENRCSAVLVLALERPASAEQPAKFTYSAFHEGARNEPLAKCEGAAKGASGSEGRSSSNGTSSLRYTQARLGASRQKRNRQTELRESE